MPTIHHGDCIEVLATLPDASVDAIVTDPPYGLSNTDPGSVADTITKWAGGDRGHVPAGRGFMGKSWDAFVPPPAVWDECMRVLKPGGHMVVFAGSRTQDLMGLSIRLAGFEIRDSMAWLYGSGFPKSHDIGKAIDKLAGAEREVVGTARRSQNRSEGWDRPWMREQMESLGGSGMAEHAITAPATPEAQRWDGWGTALKPAFEPIVLARKPLAEKTVARNVLAYGTGAINVDACRVEGEANRPMPRAPQGGILRLHGCHTEAELRALAEAGEKTPDGRDARATLARTIADRERYKASGEKVTSTGRWPANVLLDHHAAAWVDEQSGVSKGRVGMKQNGVGSFHLSGFSTLAELEASAAIGGTCPNGRDARTTLARYRTNKAQADETAGTEDQGGASRFFYTAKAPKRERPNVDGVQHPTVKPLAIMQWLLRLVTPPGGTVLDPFAGSGTTIEAALIEGFNPVGIEMEADYLPLIQHRIDRQAGTLTA